MGKPPEVIDFLLSAIIRLSVECYEPQGRILKDFSELNRWFEAKRHTYAIAGNINRTPPISDGKSRKVLFS